MKTINIDPYTTAVSPIDMYFDDTHLSRGTAFFWEEEKGQIFLVTNWHNISVRWSQKIGQGVKVYSTG